MLTQKINIFHRVSSGKQLVVMIFAVIILLLSWHATHVKGNVNSKHVYTFGDFNYNGFGSLNVPTSVTPISNPILQALLVNGTESWKLATGIERFDVTVSVQQLVNHFHAMFYVLEYFNTTSNDSLGQYIFVSGSNENGQAAVLNPPAVMSKPELIYIYTSAGKAYNQFTASRRIAHMACVRSCVILTSDGLVYFHDGSGIWYPKFSFTQYTDPDTSTVLNNVKFVSLGIGGYYGCETIFAVTNYGHVFSMGCHNGGVRGTPIAYSSSTPYIIPSLRNITSVSTGQRSSDPQKTAAGAIDVFGVLWTWGSNFNGMLGWNSTVNATSEFPQPVTLLPSKVKKIVFGYGHALATLDTGDIYCFGDNTYKQTNPDTSVTAIYAPTRVSAITENTTDCFAAGFTSACILSSGYMYSWGYSINLGHTTTPSFNKVTMVNDAQVILARFSNIHGLAITSDGLVNVWGTDNGNSIMSLGEERAVKFPRKLSLPSFSNGNVTVSDIVGGISCMFILSQVHNKTVDTNALDYWGNCNFGLNFASTALTPISAPQSFTQKEIVDVDLRYTAAIALTSGGQVYGWGSALAFSGVGGSITNPVLVATDVKKVSVGTVNTYILFKNDTLWGIGDNSNYQLGLGSSVSSGVFTTFNQINTTSFLSVNETIVDIKAGQTNVFLLTNTGNVYGCGRNGALEKFISNTGFSNHPTFVRMNGNVKFRKMYIGFYSNLLLVSTSGKFYYFYGTPIKAILPSDDSYAIDFCDYWGRFYVITKKGNLYTSGTNNAFETYPVTGFSSSLYTLYPRQYFEGIPYKSACSEGRAAIVTREEYTCFGVNSTDASVCSSHGYCSNLDQCTCDEGYSGLMCDEYSCNGISALNSSVCSGRGVCSAPETCSNCTNSIGTYCQYVQCYGVYANSGSVCSGNGNCTSIDKCECKIGFYGNKCQYRSCFGTLNGALSRQTTADVFCANINKLLK